MEMRLMNIENIPNEYDLITLLGDKIYNYYCKICESIVALLSPNLEIWDYAGRRGKYFHGYKITKKSLTIDLYLSSNYEQITCEFHLTKSYFSRIFKRRFFFNNKQVQKDIDFSKKFNAEFGGGYFINIIIKDDESFHDALQIIQIIS